MRNLTQASSLSQFTLTYGVRIQSCSDENCNCSWGTCIAPRRPRAYHRVNAYLGDRRQNETEMFSDHDGTSPSIAAVSAPSKTKPKDDKQNKNEKIIECKSGLVLDCIVWRLNRQEVQLLQFSYKVQGHSRSLILTPIESPYVTSY